MHRLTSILHTWAAVLALYAATDPSARAAEGGVSVFDPVRRSVQMYEREARMQTSAALRAANNFDAAIQQGNIAAAQSAARELLALEVIPEGIRESVQRTIQALPTQVAEREKQFIADVETILPETRVRCLEAKSEAELLPHYMKLVALNQAQPGRSNSAPLERATKKLDAALKATSRWMDFLGLQASGDQERASRVLAEIATDAQAYPLIPASELQTRMEKLSSGAGGEKRSRAELLARIKTIADVEAIGREIDALPDRIDVAALYADNSGLKRWFETFRTATRAFLNGDLETAVRKLQERQLGEEDWSRQATRLRGMLLEQVLPKYANLPEGSERKQGEPLNSYLYRILRAHAAADQWEEVKRVAALLYAWDQAWNTASWLREISAATNSWLEGQRFEQTGDYPRAIICYEEVLRSTAEISPSRVAIERLKALRQTHAAAFSEAHPRLESDRALGLVTELAKRVSAMEARFSRPIGTPATPRPAVAKDGEVKSEFARTTENRLAVIEAKMKDLTAQDDRLTKLEVLLGPGAQALTPEFDQKIRFRVWLGPDYTVYRSALPPRLEQGAVWHVLHNGVEVLGRNAANEFSYRYSDLKPGAYTVYLSYGARSAKLPASNVITFTISEEEAKKLPKIKDSDLDRDGSPNSVE